MISQKMYRDRKLSDRARAIIEPMNRMVRK
jgi:hypothetical protein